MSKLIRIIAIDNISRSQFVTINADDHANFDGENGAGKTTTLRASLLFYGTRPGDIAKAKGDTFSGFATFYYPNFSSFIVYEYERSGNVYCVITSAKNGQVQYQFMNTSYDKELFLYDNENKPKIVTTAQLRINVEHKGFELSKKMSTDVYAEIIQSNKPFRKRTGSSELIRSLRPRYSLPTQGNSIYNIDRVLANIFASKASVSHIQSALTNILVQDNQIPSRVLKLDDQSGNINEWFISRSAWLSLDARRDNIVALNTSATKYLSYGRKLSAIHGLCINLLTSAQSNIKKFEENIVLVDAKIAKSTLNSTNLKTDIASIKLEYSTAINVLGREIKELDDVKRGFEKGGESYLTIYDLRILAKKLNLHQEHERNTKKALEVVSSGIVDITSFYDTQFEAIKKSISDIENNTLQLKAEASRLKNIDLEGNRDLFDKQSEGISSIFQQRNKSLHNEKSKLQSNHATLTAYLLDISYSDEDTQAIEDINQDAIAANLEYQTASQEHLQLAGKLSGFEGERNTLIESDTATRRKRNEYIGEQNKIKSKLESGSLFDFLTENAPGFESDIGKVIKPEILVMKGLNPSFDESNNNIFGLTINLDGIEPPELMSKNSLHDRITRLDELIANEDESIVKSERSLEKINTSIRLCKGDIARSVLGVSSALAYSKELETNKKLAKEQALGRVTLRHEKYKSELKSTEHKIQDIIQQVNELDKKDREDRLALNKAKSVKEDLINTDYENKIILLDISLSSFQDEKAQAKMKLEEKKKEDIVQKGFSPERISEAESSYTEAQANVTRSSSAGERINRYNKFMSDHWPKHQALSMDLEGKSQESNQYELKAKADILEMEKVSTQLSDDRQNFSSSLIKANAEKVSLNRLIEGFVSKNIIISLSSTESYNFTDASQCEIHSIKLFDELNAHRSRGKSEFNTLETTFYKTTASPTRRFYEKMRGELSINYSLPDFWWASAPSLTEYIENEHVSQADLLRSTYILVAKKIADFSAMINSTHASLNSLGRKLTTTTKQVVERFDAIGGIEIRVSSKLKNLKYFSTLAEFSTAHDNWSIHSSNELPDDALISKLSSLINMIGKDKLQIDVDKSFLFEVILNENGKIKIARTDDEIESLSSKGLSYLITVAIYIGLINLLRTDPNIHLLFCIDEIGKLSKVNTGKLIALFEEYNIIMFSALPDTDAEILQHYPYAYNIIETGPNSRKYKTYGPESRITTETKINGLISNILAED